MVKSKYVSVDVEVMLNEKWRNYAKVTLSKPSDALAAMKYWQWKVLARIAVTLKPWKNKAEASKSQSHAKPGA